MFNPLVSFFRALPPLALIPLVISYLGIDETARLSLLTYAAFFSAVIVIYESVAAVDDVYVRAGRALGASELELFRRVVVPLTVPRSSSPSGSPSASAGPPSSRPSSWRRSEGSAG